MKFLILCLAAALGQPALAGAPPDKGQGEDVGQGQEQVDAMDAEELQVYTLESPKKMPATIVLKIDTENGKRGVYHAEQMVEPGVLQDDVAFDDVEYSEDVDWIDESNMLSLFQWRGSWHHNRGRGWGYYHRFRHDHPYYNHYGRYYPPAPGPRYRYHNRYYNYRPYHGYRVGNLIYRFFREIFD